MYKVTQKLQFYTFFYPLNVLIPSSCSQQCNGLTIFWLAEKTRLKTPIKRSKIKLLYLLAPSLFLLNRANCSACADKFPTCCPNGVVSCAYGIRVIYSFLSSASESLTVTTLFLCFLCALQILMVRHLVVLILFPQTDFHLIAVAWNSF